MSTWWRIAIAWLLALALPVQALAAQGLVGCDALTSAARAVAPSVAISVATSVATSVTPPATQSSVHPSVHSFPDAVHPDAGRLSAGPSRPCHAADGRPAMTLPDRISAPLDATAPDAGANLDLVAAPMQGAVHHAASTPHGHTCSACSACASGCHVLALPPAIPRLPMLPQVTPEAPARLPALDGQGPDGLERPPRGPSTRNV